MSTTDKNRNRLITLLKELFQLDQPGYPLKAGQLLKTEGYE